MNYKDSASRFLEGCVNEEYHLRSKPQAFLSEADMNSSIKGTKQEKVKILKEYFLVADLTKRGPDDIENGSALMDNCILDIRKVFSKVGFIRIHNLEELRLYCNVESKVLAVIIMVNRNSDFASINMMSGSLRDMCIDNNVNRLILWHEEEEADPLKASFLFQLYILRGIINHMDMWDTFKLALGESGLYARSHKSRSSTNKGV